ncbi:receptor-like protein 35 [Ziziphus jujuba]|uniref:Receptor-like protein 35 n=1 Tax=Ziziphus jujuba TaxID=326968 RepID=A0ABM4A7M2_ZIZJJ|nr:receptor-like protein 35 [Ziziphus jujuba]
MISNANQSKHELSRSMADCKKLEILDVCNNPIKDTFPFCPETLLVSKILILCFNKFNGAIRDPCHQNESRAIFPKLHIVDLAQNSFSGCLSYDYFQKWDAMKVFGEHDHYVSVKITITNKGTAREYWEIQKSLNLLDLSNNRFEGEIPVLIENLKGLNSLHLSNNLLVGHIPSSLKDLSKLEALDLSCNNVRTCP